MWRRKGDKKMAVILPWVGVRRLAIVPVFNRHIDPPPSPDWIYQIRSRMFYDPDATGVDRSFQAYLHALSYGQAFVAGQIFPPVVADDDEVNIPAMHSLPPGHGYTHMVAVLPHSFGTHRGGIAFWDFPPVNGITAWARVALYEDKQLTQRQPIGVWAMEILHMVTEFGDLYNTQPNLGRYDVMAGAGASTHASAHTKIHMGWLPSSAFLTHTSGTTKANLQAISLPQPAPPDRVTAILIPSKRNTHRFIAEARLAIDQYERSDGPGEGIPQEGVIVYEVVDTTSVFLRALLTPGTQYDNAEEGLRISVDQAIPGGFAVTVRSKPGEECPRLKEEIALLEEILDTEEDPFVRRQIRQKIGAARQKARRLGCV
jgi:hypothetical protein